MGNTPTKGLQKKGKKYVHWSNAEKPTPPGKPQLVPGTPHNQPDVVTIRWEPSAHDGGAPLTGYLVEHRRTGSPHWVRATPTLIAVPELTLSGLEPGWRYQFRVSAENAAGMSEPGELSEPLTVTLQRTSAAAPHFAQELKDTIAMENDKAEFLVQFRGVPPPKIAWFKDGFEIFSSRRTKILTENEQSSLVIFQTAFSDEGEVKCTATNRIGHVVTKAKLRLEAPPRIRLPRQYEDGLLFEMDEVIRLKVSVVGRPLPRVTWFHNGEQVVFGGRYEVANTDRFSSLRVDEARRDDRGEYQVKATNRLGEDVVAFLVTVTDRPVPPGKAKVTMTLGRSVTLSWTKPEDDGGCKIGNYIVEYYRLGWNVWLKAATCRQLTTTLGDLIGGSEYKFRVKAENPYGVSDPSGESEVVFIPDPKRGILEAPAKGSQPVSQPEIPDQQKEDRKRRRPPIKDSNIPRKEKHLDSSMEYPSSDPDSSDYSRSLETPENRRRREKELPLTVVEYDRDRVEIARRQTQGKPTVASEAKLRGKENEVSKPDYKSKTLENWISKQDSMSVPKTKPASSPRVARAPRDDGDDVEMAGEVYSLKIPVGRGTRSEERDAAKKVDDGKRVEEKRTTARQEETKKVMPREQDDNMVHGSSEMMLVLLPNTRDAQSETDREEHADFCRSFVASGNLGVAPPMSLSSPELGCGDPVSLPALRNAVSSMELLHERAMDRLYQEAEAEAEAEEASRRHDAAVRRSYERLPEANTIARNRERMTAAEETRKISPEKAGELFWHQKKPSQTVGRKEGPNDSELNTHSRGMKAPLVLTDEELEEIEFTKLRERIAQSMKDDSKEVEREMRYKRDETPPEEDDEVAEEEDGALSDEEIEEELEEEEDVDEEEEEEDEENPEEEEDESEEEIRKDSYRPGTTRRSPPLRSMDSKHFSDEEEEPYHPRAMMPRAVAVKEPPPPPVPLHREILTVLTLDDKSREVTPPVRHEPKTDLQPKPILKTTSKFGKDESAKKPKPPSPRASTPFGPDEAKQKKPILNKFLNKIESPFKRAKTPPTSDGVVRRPKKESPPKSASKAHAQEAETREGDVGLSAAEIARKRRLQTRQSSQEEDEEANKILISHYSDIVKAYGVPKKISPTLFLNTAELKAAAEGNYDYLDKSVSISPEPVEEKSIETPKSSKESIEQSRITPSPVQGRFGSTSSFKHTKQSSPPTKQYSPPPKKEVLKQYSPPPKKEVLQSKPSTSRPLRQEAQQYIAAQKLSRQESEHNKASTQVRSQREEMRRYMDEDSEDEEQEPWEFTPRHMMARLRRSLTPRRSLRRQRPDGAVVKKNAETRVHHFITYLTDLAMFLLACWLYLFKDERLAIPVIMMMVYRQMHEAIMSWVPKRWRKKKDDTQ